MPLTLDELCRDEWTNTAVPEIRLRLRRDGSGYYDRREPGKVLHEKLLFKLEGALHLKLAHARGWIELTAEVRPGPAGAGERIGQRELVLTADPYAKAIEDRPSAELRLLSDAGAELPSS